MKILKEKMKRSLDERLKYIKRAHVTVNDISIVTHGALSQ